MGERKKPNRTRETISVTLPANVLEWLDKRVEDRTFATRSFAIEKAVLTLMEEEEKSGH